MCFQIASNGPGIFFLKKKTIFIVNLYFFLFLQALNWFLKINFSNQTF
jgi:hypothetical protein